MAKAQPEKTREGVITPENLEPNPKNPVIVKVAKAEIIREN